MPHPPLTAPPPYEHAASAARCSDAVAVASGSPAPPPPPPCAVDGAPDIRAASTFMNTVVAVMRGSGTNIRVGRRGNCVCELPAGLAAARAAAAAADALGSRAGGGGMAVASSRRSGQPASPGGRCINDVHACVAAALAGAPSGCAGSETWNVLRRARLPLPPPRAEPGALTTSPPRRQSITRMRPLWAPEEGPEAAGTANRMPAADAVGAAPAASAANSASPGDRRHRLNARGHAAPPPSDCGERLRRVLRDGRAPARPRPRHCGESPSRARRCCRRCSSCCALCWCAARSGCCCGCGCFPEEAFSCAPHRPAATAAAATDGALLGGAAPPSASRQLLQSAESIRPSSSSARTLRALSLSPRLKLPWPPGSPCPLPAASCTMFATSAMSWRASALDGRPRHLRGGGGDPEGSSAPGTKSSAAPSARRAASPPAARHAPPPLSCAALPPPPLFRPPLRPACKPGDAHPVGRSGASASARSTDSDGSACTGDRVRLPVVTLRTPRRAAGAPALRAWRGAGGLLARPPACGGAAAATAPPPRDVGASTSSRAAAANFSRSFPPRCFEAVPCRWLRAGPVATVQAGLCPGLCTPAASELVCSCASRGLVWAHAAPLVWAHVSSVAAGLAAAWDAVAASCAASVCEAE
eukprot:359385-Chlamydomonas_euryale.AAC.1